MLCVNNVIKVILKHICSVFCASWVCLKTRAEVSPRDLRGPCGDMEGGYQAGCCLSSGPTDCSPLWGKTGMLSGKLMLLVAERKAENAYNLEATPFVNTF